MHNPPKTNHTTTAQAPAQLPKKYNPADHEPRISAAWLDNAAFHPDPERVNEGQRPPYCILIPPPNVTARLHLGHALNNSLQDALVRAHRMMGHETLWMPGTDHAGIATQTVVDKRLKEAGEPALAHYKAREAEAQNTGRPDFVNKVQQWAEQYEHEITNQLKEIGCSCDWQRQRFTMDDQCARAVREAFFQLFKDGLIYRGKRLVNWDPVTQTALADDEVETHEVESFFWYMQYPLCDEHGNETGEHLTVATTRPETYLGDTAVAVNPNDPERAKHIGSFAKLPLVNRVIPIIGDDYVVPPDPDSDDPKARMATGFLKVTPAHDPNDYDIGLRHNLPIINIMAPDASISNKYGWTDTGDAERFLGLSRDDARDAVEAAFKDVGLLHDKRPHTHAVGHSYRSHAPIEPYLSDQWYCRVTDDRLVGNAQRALANDQRNTDTFPPTSPSDQSPEHTLRFFPERYAKTYENWHDNLRDWCISRQLWWGHRIPVWHKTLETDQLGRTADEAFVFNGLDHAINDDASYPNTNARITRRSDGANIDAADFQRSEHNRTSETYDAYICTTNPDAIRYLESQGFTQDPDVLDTWFSSALWPLSTLGWPDNHSPLLKAFNPTDVLCTGRDIITLWVSRMAMFNRHFLAADSNPGPAPFKHVNVHPIIQDGFGQRMSKSLGNGVDPLDLVHSHGADAVRFVLARTATATQDVRVPVDLVCPHTGVAFEPTYTTSPQGYKVAAPIQTSPKEPNKSMVTAYGVASGQAKPSQEQPLARNTSTKFDEGRNFVTKLYNATKFALTKLPNATEQQSQTQQPANINDADLTVTDRWMLSRLAAAIRAAEDALDHYAFADYANAMYDILWRDLCDWYLEAVKPTVEQSPTQQAVLRAAIDTVLRLLHPICPFVTEVLFEQLRNTSAPSIPGLSLDPPPLDRPLLCLAPWPRVEPARTDNDAEAAFDELRRFTEAARQVRATNKIGFKTPITIHTTPELARRIADGEGLVETLANSTVTDEQPPPGAIPFMFDASDCAVAGFESATGTADQRAQLDEQIAKLDKDIANLEKRLANPGYVDKAPEKLVNETRETLASKKTERDAAKKRLADIA